MTENQTPKDENSRETMNSGKLETVNNTGSDTLSQDENVADSADVEQITPPTIRKQVKQKTLTKKSKTTVKLPVFGFLKRFTKPF